MEIHKTIIGLAIATVIVMGTLVPFISSAVVSYDQDGSVLSFGSYGSDELDGWSLSASVTGSAVHVTSTMWKGSVDGSTYLLASDSGNIWYDGSIHSLMGNVYRTYTSLEASIENGTLKIGSDSYALSTVYVPSSNGTFGSHNNGSVNDPVFGVGSFAGITVSGNGQTVLGNTSDYVFEKSLSVSDDRKNIEFSAGDVVVPEVDPFLPDIEHEDDPEPEPVEPGEVTSSGTTGDCTWRLEGTVLYVDYVEGEGKMADYSLTDGNPAPWWNAGITDVIIGEGVTVIGISAFYTCNLLTNVSLPDTLLEIGQSSFRGTGIVTIDLPSSLVTIYMRAFMDCKQLRELICPESLDGLGTDIIRGCTGLTHLYVPATTGTIHTQAGFSFIAFDGTNMGTQPTGDLYLGANRVMYQTITETIDGATYRINYIGAELEQSQNVETVHIPYSVTYGGTDYTVESLGHGAISGSAVRYVVIPQTIESVSSTAITAPNVQQVLNLSEVDVSAQGDVRTSVPATVTLSELSIVYSPYRDVIQAVPLLLILGFVIAAVGSIGSRRL